MVCDYMSYHIDCITTQLDSLEIDLKEKQIRHYETARQHYKLIEFGLEFASPFYTKYYLNGPSIKKSELEYGNRLFEPHGFQLLETHLYGKNAVLTEGQWRFELTLMKDVLRQLKVKVNSMIPKNETVLEMLKLECYRIASLGLSGYDCTENKQNCRESSTALQGIKDVLDIYKKNYSGKADYTRVTKTINSAQNYLKINHSFDSLNRLEFITVYIQKIVEDLINVNSQLKLADSPVNYALYLNTKKIFSLDAFNKNYFSNVIKDSSNTEKQAELGHLLFYDPVLSGNNKRACASCHKPEFAYADNVQFNKDFKENNTINRNTPGLLNAWLQRSFFTDGRSLQLEDQASDVLHNKNELNSNPEEIVMKLRTSHTYKNMFGEAFSGSVDSSITFYSVLKCLAEFEKKLSSFNSRFDQYLDGNKNALTANEIHGFNLFTGKALCGSCHFFPIFNGLVPPVFNDTEFEVIGVPSDRTNKILDTDSGRYKISNHAMHLRAFKTPTVRNIHLTAPYMHNGCYQTLDEVLEFYNKGGGKGFGFNLENQTLPFDSLGLTKKELNDIKSFMLALTDTSHIFKKPKELPSIKGIENRKIGGEY